MQQLKLVNKYNYPFCPFFPRTPRTNKETYADKHDRTTTQHEAQRGNLPPSIIELQEVEENLHINPNLDDDLSPVTTAGPVYKNLISESHDANNQADNEEALYEAVA